MYYTNINHYAKLKVSSNDNTGRVLLLVVAVLAAIINLLLMDV